MPFTIRQFRRLPACCSITYQRGDNEGLGTVWNFSVSGFRFSGDLPLDIGETCSLTVTLPNQQPVYVAAGIVRWRRGEEYGVESLGMDEKSQEELTQYATQSSGR